MSVLFLALWVGALQAGSETPFEPHVEEASPEAEAAAARIKLPEGFQASLFAAEPMLANPVCFDIDDRGRVYVGETFRHSQGATDLRDHMEWLEDELQTRTVADRLRMFEKWEGEDYADYAVASERVRRIVDVDGDGRADEASVFATGFDDPAAGIGAGLLALGPEVYYSCIPDLLLLRDADDDGLAEGREILSTGYGVNIAMIGHDLHGLLLGWDGRLYFSCGDRGFTVLTENGVIEHVDAGAVLRCELDGSGLEVWHTGLRNPQELAFDDFGNLFTGDNNSDSGDRARWVHVVENGDSGWRYSYQWIEGTWSRGPWNDEKLWHPHHAGQAAYIVPPIVNHGAGPSGLVHYPGTGFPAEYQGAFFLVDFTGSPNHSSIHSFHMLPKGASFEMGDVTRFVSGALPTDVDFGPDGALYFTDWVDGWAIQGKGRVFRVEHAEANAQPIVQETRRLLADGMQHRHVDELSALLAHADRRVRLGAQLELAGRGSEGYVALSQAALRAPNRFARLHGVWGLGVLRRRNPPERSRILDAGGTVVDPIDPLVKLLADYDAEVRAQAVRVLGDARPDWARGIGHQLVARTADTSPRVRFFAAIACGRNRIDKAVPRLVDILRSTEDTDTDLRHAAIVGLAGCASTEELVQLAEAASVHVRIGAAVALRRKLDPAIVRFLEDRDPRVVVEAARAIYDLDSLDRPDTLEALARVGDRFTEEPSLRSPAIVRRVLAANERLGSEAHARRVASFALLEDTDARLRTEALEILAQWGDARNLDRVHGRWAPRGERDVHTPPDVNWALARQLLDKDDLSQVPDSVLIAMISMVEATLKHTVWEENDWEPMEVDALGPWMRTGGLLGEVFSRRDLSSAVRIASVDAQMRTPPFGGILASALKDPDGAVRAAALRWLEHQNPTLTRDIVADVLERGDLAERRVALACLSRDTSEAADEQLTAELAKLVGGRLPDELALDVIEACRGRADARIVALVAEHRAQGQADTELGPWMDTLLGGDAQAGEAIFRERIELACQRCHAVTEDKDQAHGIGPNLAGVGKRLGRRDILESIVAPNRATTRGYDTTAFFFEEELIVGRVLHEDEQYATVLDADGKTWTVNLQDVHIRKKDLSAMPNGLGELLTPREMRDLIEYLSGL